MNNMFSTIQRKRTQCSQIYPTPLRNLARVLHNRAHQLATLHDRLQHLRHGLLLEHALLLALDGQADVDAAALRRRDLDGEGVLREVDLPHVRRVELDRRADAGDLDREVGRFGY